MIEVGIIGASGYGGGELLRLLLHHPNVYVKLAVSETYAGKPVKTALPGMSGQTDLRFSRYEDGTDVVQCEVVFLAQENGKAMETAPHLLEAGCKIVDLSADFRFQDPGVYAEWYKTVHSCPQWNENAVYGLPEIYAENIRDTSLVGNPGCYPTAAILALAPLLAQKFIDPKTIIIDAKSGVSGAGRAKFSLDYHFPEVNENVSAYKIAGTHRHTPEIEQALSRVAEVPIRVTFTPHLIPMSRGILATCYATLLKPVTTDHLLKGFTRYYENAPLIGPQPREGEHNTRLRTAYSEEAPFVTILEEGLPATKHTLGSNRCHIGLSVDTRTNRVTVVSAIDNLIKGAAGQAIQNMNLMCGFEETAGLMDIGGIWP